MKYLVIVEETAAGFSAYSPDLPGCVATGSTREEVEERVTKAISFHVAGMKAEGLSVPTPISSSTYVDIEADQPGVT
jgi:predicted RNase H-like HicB family nuclease